MRDRLLGRPVTEVDWVVVGASAEDLLGQGFRPVGTDFPVFLHPETGEEYALARTERKSGRGYGGFVFQASPKVTLEQDLARRDLTINAMAEDAQGHLIDPYHGLTDLRAGLLRHVSPAFVEDPLRVLRVARFAARYAPLGFRVAPETLELMTRLSQSGELRDLRPERCWKEISRALMEARPDVFIQVLWDCQALDELFPELAELFVDHGEAGHRLLTALQLGARHQQPLEVRWACLLRPLAAEGSLIGALNRRYKVPKNCQDAALLEGNAEQARRARQLPVGQLSELLHRFDTQRRPWRLENFVAVERIHAAAEDAEYPQGAFLLGAAECLRRIDPKTLARAGYRGAELGEALHHQQLAALSDYQRHYSKA